MEKKTARRGSAKLRAPAKRAASASGGGARVLAQASQREVAALLQEIHVRNAEIGARIDGLLKSARR